MINPRDRTGAPSGFYVVVSFFPFFFGQAAQSTQGKLKLAPRCQPSLNHFGIKPTTFVPVFKQMLADNHSFIQLT